jgi:hypothetical protein
MKSTNKPDAILEFCKIALIVFVFILSFTACKEKNVNVEGKEVYTIRSAKKLIKYLSGKPNNTPDSPYEIALKVKDNMELFNILNLI